MNMFVWQTAIYSFFLLLAPIFCQDVSNSVDSLQISIPDGLFKTDYNEEGSGESCQCVNFYLCDDGIINMNGKKLFDFRMNDPGNPCRRKLDRCCSLSKINSGAIMRNISHHTSQGCGHRNVDGLGVHFRDMLPTQSQYGEFPWMVSIKRTSHHQEEEGDEDATFQCGGSLIHPQVVLTAAHCVFKEEAVYRIRAGEWHNGIVDEYHRTQDREVERVIRNENFDIQTGYNDIALLVLTQPVELADNVDLICLPDQNHLTTSGSCIATGWGKDYIGITAKPNAILKKIQLPVVPRDQCQKNLRRTRLGRFFLLHENFMCAGGEQGKDTCEGDGGAPLVCPMGRENNQYFQVGVLSYGVGCGRKDVPGVYVSVARFRSWIDNIMNSYEFDTSVYQA